MTGLLDGIRVLDFTTMMAGPYCTRQLADLGAEIIKIEPPGGEQNRRAVPVRDGESAVYSHLNCGTHRIALDLARHCDVVVENARPGVMARLGLDHAAVRAVRPDVIYCSISGFGQTGPDAQNPAYAPVVQAASGYEMALLEQQPELTRPGSVGVFVADVVAAIDALDRPPVTVGHSLGCLLVPLAAIQRETAGLLLLCPSPPGNLPGAQKVRLVPEGRPVPPLPADVARSRYAEHLSEAELADLVARLCAESPRLLNERYDLRVAVDPAAIRAPVLVVEGGRDDPERHPPGQDQAIAAFYGAAHVRLDDAPHDLMLGPGSDRWFDAIWGRLDSLLAGR